MLELSWHSYRYYPYELELAEREILGLMPDARPKATNLGIQLQGNPSKAAIERLTYFSSYKNALGKQMLTRQGQLERAIGANRQSTRYSAHGLHEYKGKFNPQVVRALLNIFGVQEGDRVIDPFCGSGTSLLECAHLGISANGADINPLAVFIANAKIAAVSTPTVALESELATVLSAYKKIRAPRAVDERQAYLLDWFPESIFNSIERLRIAIDRCANSCKPPLLAIASNLLRDYSFQDPGDLRIRRRKSPLPEKPFLEAFEEAVRQISQKIAGAQNILRVQSSDCRAILLDSCDATLGKFKEERAFDMALTSPPYATALPYIDTQRLSLVWLGLTHPSEILLLESSLVGSREVRGTSRKELLGRLLNNSSGLPSKQAQYCTKLQRALSGSDGFRRQATPLLLYRYFEKMAQVFRSLRPMMKSDAPFALIVGHNHTTLGGKRFDIDTPRHLAEIADSCGWRHVETVPLQTYQRYGYHMDNAVNAEGLVIVRAA